MLGLGSLTKSYEACRGQLQFVWGLWTLEMLAKSTVQAETGPVCVEELLEKAWARCVIWVGWGLCESPGWADRC